MTCSIQTPVTRWEKVAETRWGRYISDIEEDAILKANRAAGKPSRALEIGCEGGRWSKLLSDLGWDMVCTDIDREALALCQKRLPSARCILVSPQDTALPCPSGSLSLMLCVEVCAVIEADWFLGEASRTLSDLGLLVGVFNNLCSLRGLYVMAKRRLRPQPWYPYYQVSYGRWKQRAVDKGFTMVYERGFCWFPFSRASDSRMIPKLTRMEQNLRLDRLTGVSPWVVFIAQKKPVPTPARSPNQAPVS